MKDYELKELIKIIDDRGYFLDNLDNIEILAAYTAVSCSQTCQNGCQSGCSCTTGALSEEME